MPTRDPPVIKDADRLSDLLLPRALGLLQRIVETRLPMRLGETLRSLARQRALRARGSSQLSCGAHCFGLAMDFKLDPRSPLWAVWASKPVRSIDGGGAPWDTGYEADEKMVARLVRPGVAKVWWRFGELAEAEGFEWGGRWTSKKYSRYPFGWDVGHVEDPRWEKLVKEHHLEPHEEPADDVPPRAR